MTTNLGTLRKMQVAWNAPDQPIHYTLRLGEDLLPLNEHIGKSITLQFTGKIRCIHCGRDTKRSFSQGYCYPCTLKLAETDLCIVRPETCHHHLGTCRDNTFAEKHCFIPHSVYLANCGSAKVGITRTHQKVTRWVDQGASAAIELAVVPDRKTAGLVEVFLKDYLSDRTNWRKMLSPDIEDIDLLALKDDLTGKLTDELKGFAVQGNLHRLTYPVQSFPKKINSHNLDTTPILQGRLTGIKGQYLVFENSVINLRKYQGYEIEFQVG